MAGAEPLFSYSPLKWKAVSPSNVALIKYMGKDLKGRNQALNGSLSLTTQHLQSKVELRMVEGKNAIDGASDEWQAFSSSSSTLSLSFSEKNRFLNHLQFLKKNWNLSGSFVVRSSNNFPSSCGLASSASSFAALTLCVEKARKDLKNSSKKEKSKEISHKPLSLAELSQMSREASGSSCRSFFSPWSLWRKGAQNAEPIDGLPLLYHMVVVVKTTTKKLSSSKAHQRVLTSPLFSGRPERAEKRLAELVEVLRKGNWPRAFSLVWSEFWDMHRLFETSASKFGYLCEESLMVLEEGKKIWRERKDGPLLTMDAGPNLHFFFRKDQKDMAQKLALSFERKFIVLQDPFLKT